MSRRPPWQQQCLKQQVRWKHRTTALPEDAKKPGHCWIEKGRRRERIGPFDFCLPEDCAAWNLLPDIRAEALERFEAHGIPWHMWTASGGVEHPSTHLLDSQVQCVNALLSAANEGKLLDLVRLFEPDVARLLEVEDGSPVAFEWIGAEDYLGEGRGKPRTRGAYVTSADAVLVAETPAERVGIIAEWKYTESYDAPMPVVSQWGTDRRDRYRPHYDIDRCVFEQRPPLAAYFHEPHYQLLRLALLAQEMVAHREFGIDRAVLLHLVPEGNAALHHGVPDALRYFGGTVEEVWTQLLPGPEVRYVLMDSTRVLESTAGLRERYGHPGSSEPQGKPRLVP